MFDIHQTVSWDSYAEWFPFYQKGNKLPSPDQKRVNILIICEVQTVFTAPALSESKASDKL